MKNCYIYFFLFICHAGILFSQESTVKTTINAFQDYTEKHQMEKIYLHLDKPYYAAGEYMYFRAYLTDMDLSPENVSSRIIYVELSDMKKNLVKRTLLYSDENEYAGQILIPDTLSSAGYHLRAYTNWMRNAGEDFFYHRDIYIGNVNEQNQLFVMPKAFDYQVSFFPEGGRILADLPNKIAFKAIKNDGFGTEVDGVLTDSEGYEILQFNSLHLGMGSFNFTPEKGITYKVSVKSNGITKEYTLPIATEGLTLSARQDQKSVYLNILSNDTKPVPVYIIGQSRHNIVYAAEVVIKDHESQIIVDKTEFPTGIAQFTLFKDGLPISERLMFIDKKDDLRVIIIPDKEKYANREKATLKIRVTDNSGLPVESSFSLSVTDDKTVNTSFNEQNIKGTLLLDSDLKGYIESPGWYFAGIEPERAKALDNLLCTQGWSRFLWDNLTVPANTYNIESDFMLSGKITNLLGKPINNATVNLISNQNIPGESITDENGQFGFLGFNCPEGATFLVQSQTKNNRKIVLDNPENRYVQTNIIPLPESDLTGDKTILRAAYMEQAGRQMKILEEIRISNLPDWMINNSKTKVEDKKETEQRITGVKSRRYGDKILNKKVPIKNVVKTLPVPAKGPFSMGAIPPPIWYIVDDGMKMDESEFGYMYGAWMAYLFESIDVLSAEDATFMYGLEFARGAYVLRTKKGVNVDDNSPNNSMLVVRPEGYSIRKEFYVPEYDKPAIKRDPTPDLRSTIYWNPVIQTNSEGRAEVSFYTADDVGSYSYILEGIGDDNIGFVKK